MINYGTVTKDWVLVYIAIIIDRLVYNGTQNPSDTRSNRGVVNPYTDGLGAPRDVKIEDKRMMGTMHSIRNDLERNSQIIKY